MVKCGLGHAVPNTVIDRPSAPPFDAASMDNRSGRSVFAYGCPLNKMGSRRHPAHAICPPPLSFPLLLLFLSVVVHAWRIPPTAPAGSPWATGDCEACKACTAFAILSIPRQSPCLVGSDIQRCGYTSLRHIPTHLPHRAKQGLAWLAYHSTIQPTPSSLPLPCPVFFPFVFAATAGRKGPSCPLRLRSRCPKRNSHQTEQI